ncbi:hypothetical protein OIU79_018756 [Salix purpurea]|uniref:Uncharacterized protein n=1 Tax=Salix purpurea TaxID=77065 RepID=A0A9Q0X1N0_SALPP|nr:hypothetical protein OIU79_018756 [Salix purpurea]
MGHSHLCLTPASSLPPVLLFLHVRNKDPPLSPRRQKKKRKKEIHYLLEDKKKKRPTISYGVKAKQFIFALSSF